MLKLEYNKYLEADTDVAIREDKFVKMLLTYSGLNIKKQKQLLKVCCIHGSTVCYCHTLHAFYMYTLSSLVSAAQVGLKKVERKSFF